MHNIQIHIRKTEVYREVALASAYTGAKLPTSEDKGAYERIATTEDDRLALERFWREASASATDLFKPFVQHISSGSIGGLRLDEDYTLSLVMPTGYEPQLTDSIRSELHSYFAESITARWFRYANKGEAEAYRRRAEELLLSIKEKLYHRKKPQRTIPQD